MGSDPELMARAVRRVAEQRIREAMDAGRFDELPGAGQPLPGVDEPWDHFTWVRRWMAQRGLDAGTVRGELHQAIAEVRRKRGDPGAGS